LRQLGLILMLVALLAPAEPLKGRSVQSLNGAWLFSEEPNGAIRAADWAKAPAPGARTTSVPSLWNCATAPNYRGVAWYWRTFTLPEAWKTQDIRVFFHGIAGESTCYLNGQQLGIVSSPYTLVQFDITKLVRWNEPNVLALRVDASKSALGGGIWQDVELVASDEAHIMDVKVASEANGWVTVRVDLENTSQKTGDAEIYLDVVEGETDKSVARTLQHVEVSPGRNRTDVLLHVKRPRLWSPADPFLYVARVSFRQGPDILDNVDRTFGFRDVRAEGSGILVNGARANVKWTKLACAARVSPEPPCSAAREAQEIQTLRAKGYGGIWVEGGPLSSAALFAADREGMLIAEGPGPGMSVADLVARDSGHPSVAAWHAPSPRDAEDFRTSDGTRPVLVAPPAQDP